jgi:hypothetical protein
LGVLSLVLDADRFGCDSFNRLRASRKHVCSELNRTLALPGDILDLVPFDPGADKIWRGVDKREVGASK